MKVWVKNNLKGDPMIWGIVIVLAIISVLTVYSASSSLAYRQMRSNTEYYLLKQSILILLSFFAMWITHKIDYRYYAGIAKGALWISIPLLLVTWKYGVNLNEASRWVTIPGINKSFQTSDLAQLALIIRMASMLAKKKKYINSFRFACLPMLAWSGLICGLIALTNFSAAILLFGTCIFLMYIGNIPVKYVAMLAVVGILTGSVALLLGQRGSTALSRIVNFVQGDISFQAEQAYIAIATGGIYGKGPGKSSQRNFLPHPYSDFIYAILIEEYGLIGGIFVLLLYLMLLFRGMQSLSTSHTYYGGMLSFGLSLLVVLQAVLNMAVAVGLGPITGLPLPFVSMGGTSLLFTGIALGIMLSISEGGIDPNIDLIKYPLYKRNAYKKVI